LTIRGVFVTLVCHGARTSVALWFAKHFAFAKRTDDEVRVNKYQSATRALFVFLVGFIVSGCFTPTPQEQSQREAQQRSEQRAAYVPQNDLEFKNYDRRQRLADDPTAILWCTSAFPVLGSPIFTVPIVGKLTSGDKRPYSTEVRLCNTCGESPEVPGPDGMYGSSGEYRYGFTPGGIYGDWYGMPVFCTTEPTVWQREATTIVMERDPLLTEAHNRAREALKKGGEQGDGEAQRIIEDAVRQTASAKKVAEEGNKQ
jgi:hypothetical protein